jgi:hypothetical protein
VGACVFADPDFESGAFGNGWNAGGLFQQIITGNAYNPETGLYDLAPFAGSSQAQVGAPGPSNVASGNGYISQLFYVQGCGTLSFQRRTYAEQPGYVVASATISTQGGTQLATLYADQVTPGVSGWSLFSCAMCDGSCSGFSFAPYVGQLLKITFGVSFSTFQGAQWIDDTCMTLGTTAPTTTAYTTPPGDICFVNSGFETGSFSPGWTPTGTYQTVTSAAYNVFSGTYNIYPYAGSSMGMAGYSGPATPVAGDGSFQQAITIPSCDFTFTFKYRIYAGLYPYSSYQAAVFSGATNLGNFLNGLGATGWTGWGSYSCTVCGTCPGSLGSYIGQVLTFKYLTSWYNSAPSAFLIDDVCFTYTPITTTVTTTAFTGTTTAFTGTTTTALTTTTAGKKWS